MYNLTRREFLSYSAKLACLMGLGNAAIPDIAEALKKLTSESPPVIWIQAQSCSGCSVSLLNSENPSPAQILTQYISLKFHGTISAATGHKSIEVVKNTVLKGNYILAVEGSIPAGMPDACIIDHEPITKYVLDAAKNANAILAIGTCASFGGIPAAQNNPTGAVSVYTFLKDNAVSKPLIAIPGCPSHPDWIIGTIAHILTVGIPSLDSLNRPSMFFKKLIHDQCPRFADYEREKFAKTFSDEGCLFHLGCMGPKTHADCTTRFWNSRINTCILANAPCIGCASEIFASKTDLSFYIK